MPEGKGFDLGRMVGPLPMGAWLGVVGAGLGIAYLVNRERQKTAAAAAVEPGAPGDPSGGQAGVLLAGGVVLGPDRSSPGSTSEVVPGNAPSTNQEWLRVASRWLIGQGYEPTLVTRALGLYLQGDALDARERAVVDEALARFGPPPQSVPVAPAPPPPSPAAGADLVGQYMDAINAKLATYGAQPFDFLARTRAAAELGYPHVVNATTVLNPRTGQRMSVAAFNAQSGDIKNRLAAGDAALWNQFAGQ